MAKESDKPQGKLPAKIIALDLDDTLLDSHQQISEENVRALRRAAALGIYVVLCSGRAEDAILPFVRRLEIAGTQSGRYIIAVNGCSVFDLHERKRIYNKTVAPEILLHANKRAKEFGLVTEVYEPDTIHTEEETEWTRLDSDLCHIRLNVVPDYETFLKQGFVKMLIPGDPDLLQKLQAVLKSDFGNTANVFISKPYFLEILPPDCGKGEAISWLSDHIGLPPGTTMGFGDSMNDESMIRKCAFGIAMKNGLQEIKDMAAFVTEKTNDESGVGDFINKYVL
ncbi:MAG: Cof-type HAD-IIB family hydrolase [Treponema sp.]|nr:HAD family phosphatase [Treponema sp.]MEE3314190.1 Cof-type HAD-IIB family hydrolase [Treponema sp.]